MTHRCQRPGAESHDFRARRVKVSDRAIVESLRSISRVRERPKGRKRKTEFFEVNVRFPFLMGRGIEMP